MSNRMPANPSDQLVSDEKIQVIEMHMMDKRKYYPLALVSGTIIRTGLYPLGLVKTRLQMQNKRTLYNGTFDAFRKITKMEGLSGLYRGYWVNSLLILPQVAYITAYEGMRQWLRDQSIESAPVRSFISGGCASIASQTFVVPIDIVSQHLMLIGRHTASSQYPSSQLNPLNIETKSRFGATRQVIQAVYEKHGLRGFYKGYIVSLMVYGPHSALWWLFYDRYTGILASIAPDWMPRLVIQVMAAPLSGCTATLITNPLDISRTRIQVKGRGSLQSVLKDLWRYEGMRLFTKAITARMAQSSIFSFFIILGYETIKRWSLLEEHKSSVRW